MPCRKEVGVDDKQRTFTQVAALHACVVFVKTKVSYYICDVGTLLILENDFTSKKSGNRLPLNYQAK